MQQPADDGFWKGMPEYTPDEVDLVAEFSDAYVAGKNPDKEAFLARCPEHAERLRPLLETAEGLAAEFDSIRQKYPGFYAWHLIGLPARCRS